MKNKHRGTIIIVATIFLFSLFYSLPSTSIWDTAFGIISPAEQRAVPERLLEFSSLDDGKSALIKFQVDRMAEIFNLARNPASPDAVLNNVVDTARKVLVNRGVEARVVDPDYARGSVSLKVAGKTGEEARRLLAEAQLYAKLPLSIATLFPQAKITLGLDLKGGIDLVYQVDTDSVQENDNIADAVRRSVEIIRNRIDMYGIAEPTIKAQDGNRIRIQLPGVKDPERVKQLIQNTAMLQFHMVIDQALTADQLEPVNAETEILMMLPGNNRHQDIWFKLAARPEIAGRDLKFAKVAFDELGAPVVHLEFNAEGAARFAQVTGSHIGEQLAIVLDRKIHSAPTIQSRVTGGMAQITGGFTLEEAQNLAIVLRAGALPASLIALESRVVGPTLGQESIRAGWSAGIVGTLLVLSFMAMFYRFCGTLANAAVLFNTLIIFAVLVFFGGTLTLPGIAGLILTVGMAVDANVIIFERIKEEYRAGKTVRAAINAGFDRAFSCIIDSNVTTLLTVVILYFFGSGPIRGFATTLGVGLIANVFTAIVCVRLALALYYTDDRAGSLSI